MAHVYHMEEWESNGRWHCGDVSALAANSNLWWYVPRLLNISLTDYIHLLLKYKASNFHYNAQANVLIFSFSSLADCRIFKNYINKQAREKNFTTY